MHSLAAKRHVTRRALRNQRILPEDHSRQIESLGELAGRFNIELHQGHRDAFARYYEFLLEWNPRVRLVGNTNASEIRDKFFLDSLVMGQAIGLDTAGGMLVDVGSGAGFPGVPIAIAWPDVAVTLVESVSKKARFLTLLARELDLQNVITLCERAELLARSSSHRERFDHVVARAIGNLALTAELCLPLVKVGGIVATTKRAGEEAELESSRPMIEALGGTLIEPVEIDVPGFSGRRRYVIIEKRRLTPDQFPRKTAHIRKRLV